MKIYLFISYITNSRSLIRNNDNILRIFIKDNNINSYNLFVKINL